MGTGYSRPLDHRWTRRIKRKERKQKKEREGRLAEAHRSKWIRSYGARFSIPFELEERGDRRESAHAQSVARGAPVGGVPWSVASELASIGR